MKTEPVQKPSPLGGKVAANAVSRRMRGNFSQAAACPRPHQSPAVTAVPLFVTFGDISPRHGENLSLPGKAFLGELIPYKQEKPPHGRAAAFVSVDENRNGSGISPRSRLLPRPRHPRPYRAAYRRCRSGRCLQSTAAPWGQPPCTATRCPAG